MKKTLIALAAVAAVGGASAQVSIYGTVDAAVTQYSSEGTSKTGLGNSQLGSSKIGFMGTEDLGGGMNAIFKLEGGLANDTGAGKATNNSNQAGGTGNGGAGAFTSLGGTQGLVFQRFSYVGVNGGFGEVRLGRDYTNVFLYTVTSYDIFGTNGPADSSALTLNLASRNGLATTANASNMVGYASPDMGGLRVRLQSFFGENASSAANSNDGNGYSAQIGYAAGPLTASVGQQQTQGTAKAAVNPVLNTTTGAGLATNTGIPASTGNYTQSALGASYDFGMAKVLFLSTREELVGAASTATNTVNMVGVNVPVGAINYKLSYASAAQNTGAANAKDNTGTLTGLGIDYALSKRTKLYGTYSSVTNDGGSAYSAALAGGAAGTTLTSKSNPTSTGLALGVFHTF